VGNVSVLEQLLEIPAAERREKLLELSPAAAEVLLYDWELWARPGQLEPETPWRVWLAMSGRGWGKTRVGAEWVRKNVRSFEFVNIAGATADDARDIMIEGESGILAICPALERPEYRKSMRRLDWPNGAKSLIFTADEPERFRGKQHQRFWGDEVAAWRYPESLEQMLLGLRLPPDPRALLTTTPRPIRMLVEMLEDPTCVVTKGTTYDNRDNLDPAFFREIIGRYEGTRLGRQELEAELLLDEGLAYSFSEHVHVVPAFGVPEHWQRFECMDFGSSAPTAWYLVCVDENRNLVVVDEHYEPGLPSETSRGIKERRRRWWPKGMEPMCFADPSVYNDGVVTNKWGRPARVADEFLENGILLQRGNNDRRAGYVRISELLKLTEGKPRPFWAGSPEALAAPSLYVMDRCKALVDQLRYAPVEEEGEPYPGEAVSRNWESTQGHAHAALRYGVLSWPDASKGLPGSGPPERSVAGLMEWRKKRSADIPDRFAF
jgi:hypothetical protein